MDTLDQEASEDEGVRRRLAGTSTNNKDTLNDAQGHIRANKGSKGDVMLPPGRAPSYEANATLTAAERRYRAMMDHAAESDALVRAKWEAWEEAIERLTWDEVCFSLPKYIWLLTLLTDAVDIKISITG